MNRNRIVIALALAVVVGLLTSTYVYRQMARTTVAPAVRMQRVVVASMRLPLGTRLEGQQLRTIPWPANESVEGFFTREEDLVGRATLTALVENELILESKLAPKEAGFGLPATIPEGMRAVSVAVNDVVAVAGFVQPGTMVDVLVTGSIEGRGGPGKDSITRAILENVRVLAAGQKVEQDKDGKPQTVAVMTLLVTPDEANKLTMASTEGRIQLALRNTIDTKKVNPPTVTRASVFQGGAAPVVRRAGGPPRSVAFVVEVIRGNKKETSTF